MLAEIVPGCQKKDATNGNIVGVSQECVFDKNCVPFIVIIVQAGFHLWCYSCSIVVCLQ